MAALSADAALRAKVGGRIHDGPPKTRLTPYLALGGATAEPFGHGDGEGARVALTVEAVAGETGRREALDVIDRAAAVLEAATPALSAGRLVLMDLRDASVARSDDGRTWRGRLTVVVTVDD
nr:DUF3168 domain-containing protein [Chthonobacter rhizosphaerae]